MAVPRKKLQLRRVSRFFGVDEYGFSCIPPKIGNVQISRRVNGRNMGYPTGFPHEWDTINDRWYKVQRSWKEHRKTQEKKT